MVVRAAGSFTRHAHGDFGESQSHPARAFFARDDLQRFASGESEALCASLRKNAGHQVTRLKRLISATPPWILSSCSKTPADSLAIESATAFNMRWPFSTVACCGLPYHPVGAMERTSVSTGW